MNMKEIEKDIVNDEKKQKYKLERTLINISNDEVKLEKIIKQSEKLAKEEEIEVLKYELNEVAQNLWGFIQDDFEYIPGYVEEYVASLEENFFSNGKPSLKKLAKYVLNKYMGY